jgi:hypothetical protein
MSSTHLRIEQASKPEKKYFKHACLEERHLVLLDQHGKARQPLGELDHSSDGR